MQLRKVEIGYDSDDQGLRDLKFYSKNGAVVLKTGFNLAKLFITYVTHTVYLQDGEQVIGYKSRSISNLNSAFHYDFQLIIGRLEWSELKESEGVVRDFAGSHAIVSAAENKRKPSSSINL